MFLICLQTLQSSSSSNTRELLDVSNTELSESFLLKKKQEEEIQRLNAEFEAQLRVDKARYERKRQELEEQIVPKEYVFSHFSATSTMFWKMSARKKSTTYSA